MTLAEKAEQLRDTANALRPKIVPEFAAIVDPTFKAHKLGPNAQKMMDKLTAPIVNNDPPCPTMGVTDGENLTPEEVIHRARAEEQAEDIARHPDGFAAKLHRRTEQYRKHPERAALDMLNAEELIRQLQKDAKDLRQWVSNLSARVPV